MINDIELLLEATLEPAQHERLVATKRWKDREGNPIEWEIAPVSEDTIKKLRLEATRIAQRSYNANSKAFKGNADMESVETVVAQANQIHIFNELLAVESTVFPDLKNARLQDKFGVYEPVALLKGILSVGGEFMEYIKQTSTINGFLEKEYEEVHEEAKND